MKTNVFCIIYATDGKPYLTYPEVDDETKNKTVPFALAQMRWNGQLGFTGGGVEKGEDIKDALIRELEEEINLFNIEPSLLEFNHQIEKDDTLTISYKLKVTYEHLLLIQRESLNAEHFMAENVGTLLLPLQNTSSNDLENVLNNNFCYTSKEELEVLIKNL